MKININNNFSLTSDDSYTSALESYEKMSNSNNYITENITPNLEETYGRTASFDSGRINGVDNIDVGEKGWLEFMKDWREEGFWKAMYDKSFVEVCGDFFKETFRDIGLFILGNADLFFLLPAVALIFATFIIGRNKFTKYILPLSFGYFVSTIVHRLLL